MALSAVYLYTKVELLIDAYKEAEPVKLPIPLAAPPTIIPTLAEDALSSNNVFSAENGLFMAFTISMYDSNASSIEEASYG